MKIVDARAIPLSYRCAPPYGSAGGMQASRGGLLVEADAPVHLKYSSDIKQMPQAAE